jgi:hypothetical protein
MDVDLNFQLRINKLSDANLYSILKTAAYTWQIGIKKALPLAGKGSIYFKIMSFIADPFFNLTGLN